MMWINGGMDKISTFPEYIAAIGIDVFALRYGVKPRTVSSWRYGERTPRPDQARELVIKSGGDLTMDMIYRPAAGIPAHFEVA